MLPQLLVVQPSNLPCNAQCQLRSLPVAPARLARLLVTWLEGGCRGRLPQSNTRHGAWRLGCKRRRRAAAARPLFLHDLRPSSAGFAGPCLAQRLACTRCLAAGAAAAPPPAGPPAAAALQARGHAHCACIMLRTSGAERGSRWGLDGAGTVKEGNRVRRSVCFPAPQHLLPHPRESLSPSSPQPATPHRLPRPRPTDLVRAPAPPQGRSSSEDAPWGPTG